MDSEIDHALKSDSLIDITTIGRKTGKPQKIEIVFHNFDGLLYISGRPGKRDWYANLVAKPWFTEISAGSRLLQVAEESR